MVRGYLLTLPVYYVFKGDTIIMVTPLSIKKADSKDVGTFLLEHKRTDFYEPCSLPCGEMFLSHLLLHY